MIVQDFLAEQGIDFDTIQHRPTYDAKSLAQAVHISGRHVAKAVLLIADSDYVLAVLPANRSINMLKLRTILNVDHIQLASETECGSLFTDCELGAVPPFGSDYQIRTLVEESLLDGDEIVFEGNTHGEAIRMNIEDFQYIERPLIASFARLN